MAERAPPNTRARCSAIIPRNLHDLTLDTPPSPHTRALPCACRGTAAHTRTCAALTGDCIHAPAYPRAADLIKSVMLMLVFTPIIEGLIIPIINFGGKFLAIYLWAFIFSLTLVMMTIYPVLIAPLFNKYDPLEDGPLKTKIEVRRGGWTPSPPPPTAELRSGEVARSCRRGRVVCRPFWP